MLSAKVKWHSERLAAFRACLRRARSARLSGQPPSQQQPGAQAAFALHLDFASFLKSERRHERLALRYLLS